MEARKAALILMKNSHFDRAPQYAVDVFKSNIQSYPIQLMYQDAKLRNTSCIPRDFLQLRNSFSSDAVLEQHRVKEAQG